MMQLKVEHLRILWFGVTLAFLMDLEQPVPIAPPKPVKAVLCSLLLPTCNSVLLARDTHFIQNLRKAFSSTQETGGKCDLAVTCQTRLLTPSPAGSYQAWWEDMSAVMHNHSQLTGISQLLCRKPIPALTWHQIQGSPGPRLSSE